ncbi:MAG: glycosyltransferase family 2 protein [Acidimicrobiia bacterium]|jgi:GT2 family glycosyltransferase
MDRPTVAHGRSIVVCCYTSDRWDRLSAAIGATADQISPPDELIVVVDYNEELLARVRAEFDDLAIVAANRHESGLSGARNTGVELASQPIVLFLDDDATPAPDWVDALAASFSDPTVVGVGGSARPDWAGGEPPWWFPEEFFWVVGCSYRGLPERRAPIRNPIGCNMAFRKEAISHVGGFSAELGRVKNKPAGAEETDLAIRVRSATGGTILYEPDAVVRHAVGESRMTLSYFTKRCYGEGRSKAVLARRVGAGDATSSERSYLKTLATGAASRLGRVVRTRRLRPLGQVLVLALGLAATGLGFTAGTIADFVGSRR